jgi:hypothetical protein
MKVEIDLETAMYLAECTGQHVFANVSQAGEAKSARRREACYAL